MSGLEIEQMLRDIDSNLATTNRALNDEVLAYINANAEDVIADIRRDGHVTIPTSLGRICVDKHDVEAVAA